MSLEDYTVAIKIKAFNELSGSLTLIARQFGMLDAQAIRFQQRMRNMGSFGSKMAMSGGILAAPFIFAIDKAAQLQKALLSVQLAAGGTTQQMDRLRGAVEKISAQTIFSNIDVANMAKLLATGTGLGTAQITSIIPAYAKFADVQHLMKGASYQESVTDAIRLAHTAGHYDAASLATYLDLLNKASFMVPGSLSEIGHALKYSQGVAKNALGVDDNNMILLTTFLNRMGFAGSRGGTNLLAAMTRSIPGIFGSGLLKGKSTEALSAMGMIDKGGHSTVFSNGKFDPFKWIQSISQYTQKEYASHPEAIARQDILKNFSHAFGVQGARVVSLLTTPQALAQLQAIGATFSRLQGTSAMQTAFQGTVAQKFINAQTNFVSAITELGYTLLPAATVALTYLNQGLATLTDFIKNHHNDVKIFAESFLALGTAFVVVGGVTALVAAFAALASPIGLVTAAVLALSIGLRELWDAFPALFKNAKGLVTNSGGYLKSRGSALSSAGIGDLSSVASPGANIITINTQMHLNHDKIGHHVGTYLAKKGTAQPNAPTNYNPLGGFLAPTTLGNAFDMGGG